MIQVVILDCHSRSLLAEPIAKNTVAGTIVETVQPQTETPTTYRLRLNFDIAVLNGEYR